MISSKIILANLILNHGHFCSCLKNVPRWRPGKLYQIFMMIAIILKFVIMLMIYINIIGLWRWSMFLSFHHLNFHLSILLHYVSNFIHFPKLCSLTFLWLCHDLLQGHNSLLKNYLETQKDITPQMRSILINWLIEVSSFLSYHCLFLLVASAVFFPPLTTICCRFIKNLIWWMKHFSSLLHF